MFLKVEFPLFEATLRMVLGTARPSVYNSSSLDILRSEYQICLQSLRQQ